MAKKKFQLKSKEYIKETTDIIQNTEDDEAALAFLKDTLIDDYPDLDLGKMDLHEAIDVLDKRKKKSASKKLVEDLNKSLGDFIENQESKMKTRKKVKKVVKKTKRTRKRKR